MKLYYGLDIYAEAKDDNMYDEEEDYVFTAASKSNYGTLFSNLKNFSA